LNLLRRQGVRLRGEQAGGEQQNESDLDRDFHEISLLLGNGMFIGMADASKLRCYAASLVVKEFLDRSSIRN
jgi:hypothetical protein